MPVFHALDLSSPICRLPLLALQSAQSTSTLQSEANFRASSVLQGAAQCLALEHVTG
jgi:hypothetical protein